MTLDVPPAEEETDAKREKSVDDLLWELLVGEPKASVDPQPEKSS